MTIFVAETMLSSSVMKFGEGKIYNKKLTFDIMSNFAA